jgi:ubiquinone biosynthesis protein COQ4
VTSTSLAAILMSILRHLSKVSVVTRSTHSKSTLYRILTLDRVRLSNVHGTRLASTTPAYEGHIPLNWFENAFLAVGSAVMSLTDPRRGGEFLQQVFE